MRTRYVARFLRRRLDCLLLGVLAIPLSHLIADDFQLAKGNYWIYRGETKYLVKQPGSDKNMPKTEVLTWKMEVVDTATRGPFFAALPGIGIVGYQYVHHGTLSETDLGLIQFGKAK